MASAKQEEAREALRREKREAIKKGRRSTYRKGAIVRRYRFPNLKEYFAFQALLPVGDPARDTHTLMAERLDVDRLTIWRITNGLNVPTYGLALAISKDAEVALDGFGVV
jgi:hypothetical protein